MNKPSDDNKKLIVNIDDLQWESDSHGNFEYEEKRLAISTPLEKLGATIYKLPPGKKCFPYHFHYANEEAVFVLEGSGSLRLHDEMLAIKKGDFIAFPVGSNYAHQMINTSQKPLLFLCFSTMIHPDISEYPDSNKISVSAGIAPGGDMSKSLLKLRFKKDSAVDYFEGEE